MQQASKRQRIERTSLDAQQLTSLLTLFPQLWAWVPQLRFVCKHWQTLFVQHLPRDSELGEQDRLLLLRTANLEAPICAWNWASGEQPLQCFRSDAPEHCAQAPLVRQLQARLRHCARVGAVQAFGWLARLASARLPLPSDASEPADAPTLWLTTPTWRNDGPITGFSALDNPLQLIALAMRTDAQPLLGAVLEQFFAHSKARLTLQPSYLQATPVVPTAPLDQATNNALLAHAPYHPGGRILPLDAAAPAAFPRRCVELLLALERERAQHLARLRGALGAPSSGLRLHCTVQRGASAPVWHEARLALDDMPEGGGFSWRAARQQQVQKLLALQARLAEQGAVLHEFFHLVGASVGLELKINPMSTDYPIRSPFVELVHDNDFWRGALASASTAEEVLLLFQLRRLQYDAHQEHDRYYVLQAYVGAAAATKSAALLRVATDLLSAAENHKTKEVRTLIKDVEAHLSPANPQHVALMRYLYSLNVGAGKRKPRQLAPSAEASPGWRLALDGAAALPAVLGELRLGDVTDKCNVPMTAFLHNSAAVPLRLLLALFCTCATRRAVDADWAYCSAEQLIELRGLLRATIAKDLAAYHVAFQECQTAQALSSHGILALFTK